MSAVAIIPARGGSVRVPRKNVKLFYGKPIIAYSIKTAKASGLFERVVVSTEDEEIAEVAMDYGASVLMRPRHLADDPAVGTQEVTAHALKSIPCEYACCIYPCAPMMSALDLKSSFTALRLNPKWAFVYVDGWFYWGASHAFQDSPLKDGMRIVMEHHDSHRYIDIDTPSDWERAERLYADLHGIPAQGMCEAVGSISERWRAT